MELEGKKNNTMKRQDSTKKSRKIVKIEEFYVT